jgi:hypothetical protein
VRAPSNKRIKLTKLPPTPFRGHRCRLMPAPARSDGGTASLLVCGVRPLRDAKPANGLTEAGCVR